MKLKGVTGELLAAVKELSKPVIVFIVFVTINILPIRRYVFILCFLDIYIKTFMSY